jgi:hypothetical protein
MLLNYVLIFISLVLFCGLAVDAGLLESRYLQLQAVAKAAAVSGSMALQRGDSPATVTAAAQSAAAANGYTNGVGGVSVTVANPPVTGAYKGNSAALTATVLQAVPTTFLGILGMSRVNMQAQALQLVPTPVSLTSNFNWKAIYTDGTTFASTGGFDAGGSALSANAIGQVRASNNLGALVSWRGNLFNLGPPNTSNGVSNTTISLPKAQYSQLQLIVSSANGPYSGVTFVVTYSDTTTTRLTQNVSDWCYPQSYPGESMIAQSSYRNTYSGGNAPCSRAATISLYGYSINLDSTKTLNTLTLPANPKVILLALDLLP